MPQNNLSRTSMRDIAMATGYSVMTVSRVLRNESCTSATTAEKIRKAAIELNYRPDPFLSGLMHHLRQHSRDKDTARIAFITNYDTMNGWKVPVTVRLFQGAHSRANQFGYKLDVFWLKQHGMTPRRLSEILINRGIRGVLLAPNDSVISMEGFLWDQFAWATMGFSIASPEMHRSCSNQFQSMDLAIKKSLEYGYKRIGFFNTKSLDERVRHRYLAAYHYHQSTWDAKNAIPVVNDNHYIDLRHWYDEFKPDVIITSAEELQEGSTLREMTLENDCGLISLNTTISPPEIAGIEHHSEEVGAAAIDLIDTQLRNNIFGLPKIANVTQIECVWEDGTSLPNKNQSGVAVVQ